MQTTHKISGDSATGYAAYVTSASDRGDYYTAGGEGEAGGGTVMAPSRWHGSPAMLADLNKFLGESGFQEGNHSEPGHFVIEKAFVEK